MIQRIQTLYLLLIVALGITLCFVPVVQLITPEEATQQRMYELKAIGLHEVTINNEIATSNGQENTEETVSNTISTDRTTETDDNAAGTEETQTVQSKPILNGLWGLLLTTLCIPVLALVDIFLYRKRILQARLNIFLSVLCVGYYGILAMFVWFAKMNLGTTEWHLYVWSGIPLVCLVLTLMATRRILKDEALVRAADRLR